MPVQGVHALAIVCESTSSCYPPYIRTSFSVRYGAKLAGGRTDGGVRLPSVEPAVAQGVGTSPATVNENKHHGPIGCLAGGLPKAPAGPTNGNPPLSAVWLLARFTPFRLPKKLCKITWLSTASLTAEYSIRCGHPCVAKRIATRGWAGQWLLVWRAQSAVVYDTGIHYCPMH